MADEVAADTDALSAFVDGGGRYATTLQGIHDELQRRRSTVQSALGAESPGATAPFGELISEVIINTTYVEVVRNALLDFAASGPLGLNRTAAVNQALADAGLALDGSDLDADNDQRIADLLEGDEGRLERLQQRMNAAASRGDVALVAQLQEEADQIILSGLDQETRSSLIVGRHFEDIFGTDRLDGDLQQRFANIEEEEVRARLAGRGLEGQALDNAVAEIMAAADFYASDRNSGALRTLDDANDGNGTGDGDGDQVLSATDAWLVTARRTHGDTTISGATIRQESIAGWVVASELNPDGLEAAYGGRSPIGALDPAEQDFLVVSYVGSTTNEALRDGDTDLAGNDGLRELFLLREAEYPPELQAVLTEALAAQAVSLEMRRADVPSGPPGEDIGALVSGTLSTTVIAMLGDEAGADLIDGMDPTTAALFASALNLDEAPGDFRPGSLGQRVELVDGVLQVFNERARHGGAFTESASGFTFMVLADAPIGAYFDFADPTAFSGTLAEAVAIAANPDDGDAQKRHTERLRAIFATPEAMQYLAANSGTYGAAAVDAGTRTQLVSTTVFGRAEVTHHYQARGFWTAEDFRADIEGISTDVMIDVARQMHVDLYGTYPDPAFEAELAAIGLTGEGQDLLGLNSNTNFGLRSQLIGLAIENGWAVTDFGDGDGWSNPTVNGDYLVLMAELTNPGYRYSEAELDRLRTIGASPDAQRYLGLQTDLTDLDRALYVDLILRNQWTAEIFAGDPIENDTVNNALAEAHFSSFGENTELADELADLSAAGDTEGYVRAALGLGPIGGDGVVDQIVSEINANSDGGPVNLIPVHLNTGSQSVTLMLFEVRDGDKTRYIDLNGKHYDNVGDWREHNEMPPGRLTFAGLDGGTFSQSEFVAPGSGAHYQIVSGKTKEYPDTFWEQYGGPIITGVVIIAGVAVIIGTFGAATPLVSAGAAATIGTVGAYTLGGVAAYELARGGDKLYDHIAHGGSWSDPVAMDAYLSLGEGTLGVASFGTYGVATRAGRLAPRLAGALTWTNRGIEVAETGLNGIAALRVLDSDLPPEEKRKQLIMLGAFSAVEFGVPFATNRVVNSHQDLPDGVSWTQAQHAIALGVQSADEIKMVGDALRIRPNLTTDDLNAARAGGAANGAELALVAQTREAGVRLAPAVVVQAGRGGLDAATITAVDNSLTADGRSALAEVAASSRVVGLDQWFPHTGNMATGSDPAIAAAQVRRAEYEVLAVQHALTDPYYAGNTFDLSADANAPIGPGGGKLVSADVNVLNSNGDIIGHVEIGSIEDPIHGAKKLESAISHAIGKKGAPRGNDVPLAAVVVGRDASKLLLPSPTGGDRIDNFIASYLNGNRSNLDYDSLDRIVVMDADSGDVIAAIGKSDSGTWVRQ